MNEITIIMIDCTILCFSCEILLLLFHPIPEPVILPRPILSSEETPGEHPQAMPSTKYENIDFSKCLWQYGCEMANFILWTWYTFCIFLLRLRHFGS